MTDVNAPEVNVYVCIGHANTPPVTSKLSRVVAALAAWGRKSATPRTRRPATLRMAILPQGVFQVSPPRPSVSSGGLEYARARIAVVTARAACPPRAPVHARG